MTNDGITFTMRMWPDEIRRLEMTDDEPSKLEAIARKATLGPWRAFQLTSFSAMRVEASKRVSVCEFTEYDHRPDERANDAAHIAAFSPDVALRLIARLREYERRHPDSACCVNIGRRGGYWNCTCEPGVDDADP